LIFMRAGVGGRMKGAGPRKGLRLKESLILAYVGIICNDPATMTYFFTAVS